MELQQHAPRHAVPGWLAHELDGYRFFDARLARRLKELATQLWGHLGQGIPMACQDWANTKAAYRFLSNAHVREDLILEGHFHSTLERFCATTGPVLVLHDTITFSFQRADPIPVGITHKSYTSKDKQGRPSSRTVAAS